MQPLIVYGPEIAFSPSIIRAIGLFRTVGLYIYCFKGALSLCLLFVKVFRYESCCELSSWLSVACWLFPLVLPMLTILLTRCRPCMGLLLWPQKLAILGIVASGVQIGRSVTSEAPIRINVVLWLAVFIVVIVVCADGHCEPFCCLARVIYPEWCRNNLDSWCPIRGCAIHGVLVCTTVHGTFVSSVNKGDVQPYMLFGVLRGMCFFIQTIAQVKINLAVTKFGGSFIMIAGQGRLRKPVPEQHPRRVPFLGRWPQECRL